jgi:oxepin-CoA hydrolase/3-oxo-5,6-dehydrosuberyl-CoA semialdehyde dehydrogenase
MITLRSWVAGQWADPRGARQTLVNPATEEPLAEVGATSVPMKDVLDFARRTGGAALRALTYAQRGQMLRAMVDVLQAHRNELLDLAVANGGNTRSDAKFDVDGALFTLSTYADLGQAIGEVKVLADGEGIPLARNPRFHGQHLLLPRPGVAVHINAFNFPAWGFAEKAAAALLAGMPVVSKPATSSALVTFRMFELLVEKGVVPAGGINLIAGGVGDLLEHLTGQDVVAFTGSSDTGLQIRSMPAILRNNVRVNVEADSLNAAVLGPDVDPGSDTWDYYVKDVLRDMTQKAGQKCTAIRRILVPAAAAPALQEALVERLSAITVGNPALENVRMGPVATRGQLQDVREGVEAIAREGRVAFGDPKSVKPVGTPEGKGFFTTPVLLQVEEGADAPTVHGREVFGPVATLIPYDGRAAGAVEIVARGQGGLVSSVYSEDTAITAEVVLGLAPWHGRVFLGSAKIAEHAPGPGTVLPLLVHGGPGRAGGGEELGGLRGLGFYSQRVALEGSRPVIDRIVGKPSA